MSRELFIKDENGKNEYSIFIGDDGDVVLMEYNKDGDRVIRSEWGNEVMRWKYDKVKNLTAESEDGISVNEDKRLVIKEYNTMKPL